MFAFLLNHGWHLLAVGPVLLIVACIFMWPIMAPILIARPWIAAVALAMLVAYGQQLRIVVIKHEVTVAENRQHEAETKAQADAAQLKAIVESARAAAAEAQGRASAATAAMQARDARTAAAIKGILSRPIPPNCDAAIAHGDAFLREQS